MPLPKAACSGGGALAGFPPADTPVQRPPLTEPSVKRRPPSRPRFRGMAGKARGRKMDVMLSLGALARSVLHGRVGNLGTAIPPPPWSRRRRRRREVCTMLTSTAARVGRRMTRGHRRCHRSCTRRGWRPQWAAYTRLRQPQIRRGAGCGGSPQGTPALLYTLAQGYRLNRARASASNPRLTRDASQLIVPSRIALARRGSLWALATSLAVLASARLLRRYGRLNFIEFSSEKVAYRRRFSRSSPPARREGFAPTASPHTPGGCLGKYRRTPGQRKMDQCGNLAD
jgi:hypothetical protein